MRRRTGRPAPGRCARGAATGPAPAATRAGAPTRPGAAARPALPRAPRRPRTPGAPSPPARPPAAGDGGRPSPPRRARAAPPRASTPPAARERFAPPGQAQDARAVADRVQDLRVQVHGEVRLLGQLHQRVALPAAGRGVEQRAERLDHRHLGQRRAAAGPGRHAQSVECGEQEVHVGPSLAGDHGDPAERHARLRERAHPPGDLFDLALGVGGDDRAHRARGAHRLRRGRAEQPGGGGLRLAQPGRESVSSPGPRSSGPAV